MLDSWIVISLEGNEKRKFEILIEIRNVVFALDFVHCHVFFFLFHIFWFLLVD